MPVSAQPVHVLLQLAVAFAHRQPQLTATTTNASPRLSSLRRAV